MEKFFLKLGFTPEKAKEAAEKAAKNDIQDGELDGLIADTITTAWGAIKSNGKLTEEITAPSFRAGREDNFKNTKTILQQTLGIDLTAAKDNTELSRTLLTLKTAGGADAEKMEAIKKQAQLDAEMEANKKIQDVKSKHQKELLDVKFGHNLDRSILGAIGSKQTVIDAGKVNVLVRSDLSERYKLEMTEDGTLARILDKDGTEVMDASKTRKLTNEEILAQVVTPYVKQEEVKAPEPQRKEVILGGNGAQNEPKVGHFK